MKFTKIKDRIKMTFTKKNIVSFLDKQGFYIVLFLCICIIGATALWTSGREVKLDGDLGMDPPEQLDEMPQGIDGGGPESKDKIDIKVKEIISDEEKAESDEEDPEFKEDGSGAEEIKGEKAPDNNEPANTANEISDDGDTEYIKTVASQNRAAEIVLYKPVEGNILKEFAMEELVYSKTLKEWSTHPGIDIESPLGEEVKAAMAGTIEKIEEDSLMGIVITIDHGNELKTRYANLSTKDMVREGQKVDTGQTISGVGRTAAVEISDPPHLHFELLIKGEYENPEKYLR